MTPKLDQLPQDLLMEILSLLLPPRASADCEKSPAYLKRRIQKFTLTNQDWVGCCKALRLTGRCFAYHPSLVHALFQFCCVAIWHPDLGRLEALAKCETCISQLKYLTIQYFYGAGFDRFEEYLQARHDGRRNHSYSAGEIQFYEGDALPKDQTEEYGPLLRYR